MSESVTFEFLSLITTERSSPARTKEAFQFRTPFLYPFLQDPTIDGKLYYTHVVSYSVIAQIEKASFVL